MSNFPIASSIISQFLKSQEGENLKQVEYRIFKENDIQMTKVIEQKPIKSF